MNDLPRRCRAAIIYKKKPAAAAPSTAAAARWTSLIGTIDNHRG